MLHHEGHVLPGGSAGGKSGRGLDVVGARGGDQLAHLDLLLLGEEACLHDNLEDAALAALLHGLDLSQEIVPLLILHPADVDDHVDLVGAVTDGVLCLKDLYSGGGVSVGEADDRTDLQVVAHVFGGLADIGGGNAHRGALILAPIVTDLLDLRPGGLLLQEGMVTVLQDLLYIHR